MSLRLLQAVMMEDIHGQCHHHTSFPEVSQKWFFVSGQYLENGLTDSIQIWHLVVTGFQGVPYFKVTLNSHV